MEPNQPSNPQTPQEPSPVANQSLPEAQPLANQPVQVTGIDSAPQPPAQTTPPIPKEDEIFVINPEPDKPVDKKSVALTAVITVVGILFLIGVLIMALIGSASGLANDYRRLAIAQMVKLDDPIKEIEPSNVLNKRKLDKPQQTITLSEQSQPSLENVLFIADWSERYKTTKVLQSDVHQHYKLIKAYISDIQQLIAFDDAFQKVSVDEVQLGTTVVPSDPITIRAASGSFEDFGSKLKGTKTPSQIEKIKKEIVSSYENKSAIYLNWAKQQEAGDATAASKAAQETALESAKIAPLTEDQNYVKAFEGSYKKVKDEHSKLKTKLAN